MLIHLDLSHSRLWELVTCKQFDPGQTRETEADLDPNHLTSISGIKAWGLAFSLSFPRFAVCHTWRTLQTAADPGQVLRHAASGRTYIVQSHFVKLIK